MSTEESSLGTIPSANSGVGSSDIRIASLFEHLSSSLHSARNSSDLENIRRLLADINFELTKYGGISLSAESWRPKIDVFVDEVLRNLQIQPIFALDIRDIENDTAAMLDHLTGSLVDEGGEKDSNRNFKVSLCSVVRSILRLIA
jgi:hypothetical protein